MPGSVKPPFTLPVIQDSQTGWGPTSNVVPSKFRDIPYAPYSKGDKLGRVADWTNPEAQKQDNRETTGRSGRTGFNRFNRDQNQVYGAAFASAFAYTHTEDESSFSVVDNRSAAAKKMALKAAGASSTNQRGRVQNKQATPASASSNYRAGNQRNATNARQQQNRRRYGYKDYDKPQRVRNSSINIGNDWKVLDEIEFSRLGKLTFTPPEATDIASYGAVNYYNKDFDRVNTRNEKRLQHVEKARFDLTASEDPVLQEMMKENKATVFATDSVLALLMCATRTVFPWDIIIKKADGKIVLDKRSGGVFDYVTVSENSYEPPPENEKETINSSASLSMEATTINRNFVNQVMGSKVLAFEKPNPFATPDTKGNLASCGYRYRQFDLSNANSEDEEKTLLVVRTEVDAVVKLGNQGDTFMTIRALNEFDPHAQGASGTQPWKKSLDSQRGAVVAAEMKNNAAKLARWTVQALLAGAEQLKLGYVARMDPKNNTRHTILGTQAFKPRDFAAQMNLSLTNGWGIVKAVTDMCLLLPDGSYALVKDPNRPVLRFYAVSDEDDLNNEEEEEEEEEEDDASEAAKDNE